MDVMVMTLMLNITIDNVKFLHLQCRYINPIVAL